MDVHLVVTFAVVTLFETLNPGPSFALVLETRASLGRQAARYTVLGITFANILGVVLVIFAGNTVAAGEVAVSGISYIGAWYLIFLATQRILSSAVILIAGGADNDYQIRKGGERGLVAAGFVAHLMNPFTILYYISILGTAAAGKSMGTKIALGAIAVLVDLLVYEIAAQYKPHWMSERTSGYRVTVFRLIAGSALLYLVGRTFSNSPESSADLLMTPGITLAMLAGFLCGSIAESYGFVLARKSKDNKMVWRVVSLWGVWFSVYALFGALYTLVDGINADAIPLPPEFEARFRICFVVAVVVAAALTFAKAFGELQDEQCPPGASRTPIAPTWQANPFLVGLAVFGFLIAVFGLLVLTDVRVQ